MPQWLDPSTSPKLVAASPFPWTGEAPGLTVAPGWAQTGTASCQAQRGSACAHHTWTRSGWKCHFAISGCSCQGSSPQPRVLGKIKPVGSARKSHTPVAWFLCPSCFREVVGLGTHASSSPWAVPSRKPLRIFTGLLVPAESAGPQGAPPGLQGPQPLEPTQSSGGEPGQGVRTPMLLSRSPGFPAAA